MAKKNYDVLFNDDMNTNSKGFKGTFEECLNYIKAYNGTDESYFKDYKGGTVYIYCVTTGKMVYHTTVR